MGPILLVVAIPTCLLGLLASIAVCGPRGVLAAARFLIGRASESELPLASRALGAGGRFVIHLGVAIGCVTLLSKLDVIRSVWLAANTHTPMPAEFGAVFPHGILLAIPLAILAGRFALGAAAERAALRCGIQPPTFSAGLQVASMLLVPVQLALSFVSFASFA